MENIKGECNDNAETSASINKNLDIPLITKKKLNLRDLKCKNKDLSRKCAEIKQIFNEKENYFSFKEKGHNANKEKLIKEYKQAIKDNCDRQIILEEKIKNKENKIKLYDLQIKKFKLNIGDMHERIKKARYETLEREKSLSFLDQFKDNPSELVQLDMFDRLETIFSSRKFIKKKKEKLNAKINIIKEKIKELEEKNNLILMNKETQYKKLQEESERIINNEKEIKEELKENINEHNKDALLLYKIISCIDNFLSRFSSFLPELRHYNIKKDDVNSEKKNKAQDIIEDPYFIDTVDFNNLEDEILKKLDLIYKYIKDTIYIINKAKKEIPLKDGNQIKVVEYNLNESVEFFTYNGNGKGKNN
ncbi:conserved Plasmodium protein, unknown function [Plasmodium berghei]|uniref:Uncharacterized protein n=2 Tax=Plasmodium berghei TaxID=5821 RepID=A0A509AJ03_PLABA|nr:conserved Plasmodium protein, unknown function [Plasmodium berghei ANKA]CXI45240.1 conserved Plasmodium protein, unknown function [Plasmodium berghei]SCM22635.1 conserved Plasmodium protein, unknown function [Plasmodium berghei]SCN25564.1 conserved Plasmodium protein, unknown function [Plasmodium berghei]SCO60516.1 conserved Plasmodium protein, unknown function [Plasmodium berghei]SCO62283.1 conserved Plasmodium protein, unknown function [Plasmodium berghei]|eukprot:XP_034421698.1 conserved Plasmodium protein, unknown function [Plasmodium berghei ANKA]